MHYLVLKDVCKTFDDKSYVLDHINLEINQGEFVVLVGPSGCGKSTILRLIAGLEQATSGDITIGEKRVNDVPPVDRDIAMVFQDYALYPHMTVGENMSFGLRIRKTPKDIIASKIKEAARILNIEPLLDRKPAQLSGGQRQRVAIGRAIVREPKLFLYDEPLSNLDAKLRADMRIDLAALHQRVGKTSIYVTHDQQEAMTLADRIVVLDKGRIQQVGTPMELYMSPVNTLVAGFIGSPTMNLLDGDLTYSQDGKNNRLFHSGGFTMTLPTGIKAPQKPGRYRLGVRPEDIDLALATTGDITAFKGNLLFKELHGHETQVVARIGEQKLIARISSRQGMDALNQMRNGDAVQLPVHTEHLHWFATSAGEPRVTDLN